MLIYKDLFNKGATLKALGGGLIDQFGWPPFSVLDARSGAWQERKAAWLSLGIRSELGRGENLLKFSDTVLQPDAKKRAKAKASKANGKEKGFGGNQQYGGLGDNPEVVIPSYYHKINKGMTKEEVIKEYLAKGGTGVPGTVATGESAASAGTSIFDPVLCELAYRWFCPKEGVVFDPYAGGSVRGVIASKLGYYYTGVDLRKEQVEANYAQAEKLNCDPSPEWIEGDSRFIPKLCKKTVPEGSVDFVFSCPPYYDLEAYSEDERDLSGMTWAQFQNDYALIIENCAARLKDNRFACFVIGDVRDKKTGLYRGLPWLTINAFKDAGMDFYNQAILVTAVGSLSIRVGRSFKVSRKLGTTHQHVLVFVKGDGAKAAKACVGDD